MLIPKQTRIAVYSYILKEGVLVAKKDYNAPKHAEIENVKNLHVIKLMQSLKSRELVTETFSWMTYYWYLTNKGIEYLRNYLHLPETIVPATQKKKSAPRPQSDRGDRQERHPRRNFDQDKKVGPGGDFQPSYRGSGFGRGQRPEGGFNRQ